MQSHIESGASTSGFPYGYAHAQGRRSSMEDAVLLGTPIADGMHLFAVFDGHGGTKAVDRLTEWLPAALHDAASTSPDGRLTPNSISSVFKAVDERLLEISATEGGWSDGATALLALAFDADPRPPLQLVQLGDSQAALCGAMGVSALCSQHRVGEPAEDDRLAQCSATTEDGRVVGGGHGVAVTRCFGDAAIKRAVPAGLVATPEVREQLVSPADELLILGCDGLWDVMDAEEAWRIAQSAGKKNREWTDLAAAARALVQGALDRASGDNVSVVVVQIKKPRSRGGAAAGGRGGAAAAGGGRGAGQKISVTVGANGAIQRVAMK